jgi:hypothetical protein
MCHAAVCCGDSNVNAWLVNNALHTCCPQAGFKRDLIKEVHAFVADAQAFRRDWEANGPMVPGLDPMEAVDRLKKFQQMFEVRFCVCDLAVVLMPWH